MKEAFVVQYNPKSENERKRIEYIISKWEEKVRKAKGSFIFVNNDAKEFINDLQLKVDSGKIEVFKISKIIMDVEKAEKRINVEFKGRSGSAWLIFDYIIAKKRGKIVDQTETRKVYRIISRKGKAKLTAKGKEIGDKYKISVIITGNEEILEDLEKHIKREERTAGRLG